MYRNKQLDRNSICIKVATKKYRWKKPGKNFKNGGWLKNNEKKLKKAKE